MIGMIVVVWFADPDGVPTDRLSARDGVLDDDGVGGGT